MCHARNTMPMEMMMCFERLSLDQIADYREAIEGRIATRAAEMAGPEDIYRLNQRLEVARSFLSRGNDDVDKFIDVDKTVHLCIAQITTNPLFVNGLEAALGINRYFCRFLKMHPRLMEVNFANLASIVQAIEAHRPDRADRLARDHISLLTNT